MEDEEDNNIEDEMEDIEEEIKESSKANKNKQRANKAEEIEEEALPTERYTAFYQEAKIGILDTITKEIVVEGLTDVSTATLEALKLNKLDKIEIASG